MPLIAASYLNDHQYHTPDFESKVTEAFITMAEDKYLIPVLTQVLYDDIIAYPANYTTLINKYIAPCLSDFARMLLYNQFLADNSDTLSVSDQLRRDNLADLRSAAFFKLNLLAEHLKTGIYELYITPVSATRIISGFLITQSNSISL